MNTKYDLPPVASLAPDIAQKINALHDEAQRLEKQSRNALDGAVAAAWNAGKLLIDAKKSIVRHGGHGAWLPWVKSVFRGGLRTAQRYMKLAREVSEPTSLSGLSLRQAYFRLGIATEPKAATRITLPTKLPAHISLANKLIRVLRISRRKINTQDLSALYSQLRQLFEAQSPAK